MNNEFMTNMFIDAVQNAKREWIKTFVQTETLAKPMRDFVDLQGKYTKELAGVSTTINNALGEVIAKQVKS